MRTLILTLLIACACQAQEIVVSPMAVAQTPAAASLPVFEYSYAKTLAYYGVYGYSGDSLNINVPTVSNGMMFFQSYIFAAAEKILDSVKVGSIRATKVFEAGTTNKYEIWKASGVSAGSNVVVFYYNADGADGVNGVTYWSNVDQTDPISWYGDSTEYNTSPALVMTSSASELVEVFCVRNGATHTVGAGETQTYVAGVGRRGTVSRKSGASSVSVGGTLSESTAWIVAGYSIRGATP